MKRNNLSKLIPAAILATCFTAGNASAVTIRIDEGGFTGWTAGAAHQTSLWLAEEANSPANDIVGTTAYSSGTFSLSHPLIPEGPTTAMDIEGSLHLNYTIGNGVVFARKFNIYDPAELGGALSDTLIVTLTGLVSETSVDYHFLSDSLAGGGITAYTGTLGTDLFNFAESGRNDSLNAITSGGWLAGTGVSTGDLDIQVRSAVPEPTAIGFGFALAGTFLARRRRGVAKTA